MFDSVASGFGFMGMLGSLFILIFVAQQFRLELKGEKGKTLSLPKILLACYCYTCWTLHGFLKPNWFLFTAQFPGMVLVYIMLVMWIRRLFRSRRMRLGSEAE